MKDTVNAAASAVLALATSPENVRSMPTTRPDVIRVILADDHLVVRAGLKALLGTSKDIEVVGEATNGRDAVALVERLSPHIALLDLDMPQMDGLAATKELVARGSATRVLILTMHTEDEYLVTLLEAGAAGYLVKNAADRELADAVRAVAAGGLYVQPAASLTLAREVARRAEHADEREKYLQLSERERDVLVLVASGHSASEIGEKLFISPKTVETYKQRITEKLNLSHRPDYVQFCLRLGLLQAK
ncbi:MAG: response regulator receiver [Gemmatimonadetes bacterium]|jgi:DNA-binding NarL/FixJ family response regulator|nr:response regulator receiver [Gemmatimonadota bacterium]